MKRFINTKDTIVTEALDGLAALASVDGRDALVRLDGYPYIKVVTRAEIDPHNVVLVSGGGAGHEPAHAGFVAPGMLSAAVSGEIFASPSVEAVYAGIMAVTGEPGCLLIVKNYTGDRLNFGLAAERARAQGKRVETVLVADDIALPDATQPRGVAGTLFVHKIAGHLAEQGHALGHIADQARAVAADIRSLGVSLQSCTIPGQLPTERLAAHEGELGLGIHGEPGVEKFELESVRAIVELMTERLLASLPDPRRRHAALLNNLGAVPTIEMSVITHELLRSRLGGCIELLIGPAPLMTSLDMNGFSLSLLPLDDRRREALVSPCGARAWPGVCRPAPLMVRPLPARTPRIEAPPSSDARVERALSAVLERMISARELLDEIDGKIGDGDTGSTLATAARAVRTRFDTLPFAEPALLLATLGELLAESMGGSSGVLLSIFCTAASQACGRGLGWLAALLEGVDRMREYGGAQPGDRSMLDALVPGFAVLQAGGDVERAAQAAREGAERTATMTHARAGRAAYLSAETLAGVPDPGAVAVALAFEAIRDALAG